MRGRTRSSSRCTMGASWPCAGLWTAARSARIACGRAEGSPPVSPDAHAATAAGSDDLLDCTCSHAHVEGADGTACTCKAGYYRVNTPCSCEDSPAPGWMTLTGYVGRATSGAGISTSPISDCVLDSKNLYPSGEIPRGQLRHAHLSAVAPEAYICIDLKMT